MTSSSSLYGSVTTQNASSTNSTSLYGGADTPIPDSSGNVVVRGDLYVLSGNILTTATTGNIFPQNATTINLGNAATTVNIGAGTGTTTINNNLSVGGSITGDSGDFGNITIGVVDGNTIATTSGDLNLVPTGNNGVNITSGSDFPTLITRNVAVTNTAVRGLSLSAQTSLTPAVGFGNTLEYQVEAQPGNTERAGYISVNLTDITPGSEDFSMYFGLMQNGAVYDTKMILDSTGSLSFDNDLTIGGTSVNLAQDTGFLYSENNNRLNRPYVQSTTGNTSGFRVRAPNATTSAISSLSVSNTNDASNNTFLSIQARGSAIDPLRISTGKYTANVLGPSGDSITFIDGTTTYATVNPSGPTIGTDLTTKTYVDAQISTGAVTSITGTANQVIASNPTGAVTLSLPQSIGTSNSPTFAGATLGNITVGVADDQTITTTTGRLVLKSATGEIDTDTSTILSTNSSSFFLLNSPTTVNAFQGATTLTMGPTSGTTRIQNDLIVGNDLTVNGNNVNLATGTTIGWNGNNTRANYPSFQSTSGNTSSVRVLAPNATTSATAQFSAFATNDINNSEFLSVRASGSTTAPFIINTGKYTGGVIGTSGKSINFVDNSTTYASINPSGPTNGTDLTTKTYVDGIIPDVPTYDTNVAPATGGVDLQLRELNPPSITIVGTTTFLGGTNISISETSPNVITIDGTDLNTTYNIDATSTTGGANLNLNGSDSSVDSVAFKGFGATTITRTDANTITVSSTDTNTTYTQDVSSTTGGANLNLVGSDLTTDSVKFAGGTNVSIVATDASTMTINATDTNTTYDFNATATTGGANLNLVGSDSTTDTVKLTNGGHITATYTSGTEVTLGSDATDANTASAIVARDGSGNFSASTGTFTGVKVSGSSSGSSTFTAPATGSTLSYVLPGAAGSANTVLTNDGSGNLTWALPGGGGSTFGNVSVGVDTDQTISTTSGNLILQTAAGVNAGTLTLTAGANGAITLAPNGTGSVVNTFSNGGNLSSNRNIITGAIRNATTQAAGDIWALNVTGTVQPMRGISVDNSADTSRTAGYVGRTYSNTSTFRSRVQFERARGTAASPTAVQIGDFLGEVGATGYSSTGWINDTVSAVPAFFGFTALENWVSNTNLGVGFALSLAPTATTITSAANNVAVIAANPQGFAVRSDAFSIGQGKTASFVATGCSTSGSTLTIGTVTSGTVAVGALVQTSTNTFNAGTYIVSGSGSTWTLSSVPGTQSSLTVTGNTGYIGAPTSATTVDALQDLRLLKNAIKNSAGTTVITTNTTNVAMALPVAFPTYTKAAANAITGAVGWQICITDSAAGSNPNGMMAFWDTTNARWSYVHDNSAV